MRSYGLYFLALFTWAIHLWVATLNIKLRHFNAANIQSYIDDFKLAANLAKGGLIIEVLMVSFVRLFCFQAQFFMAVSTTIKLTRRALFHDSRPRPPST